MSDLLNLAVCVLLKVYCKLLFVALLAAPYDGLGFVRCSTEQSTAMNAMCR